MLESPAWSFSVELSDKLYFCSSFSLLPHMNAAELRPWREFLPLVSSFSYIIPILATQREKNEGKISGEESETPFPRERI